MPNYGQTDAAETQKMQDRLSGGTWFKFKEGVNRVRIMPPWLPEVKKWWYEWTIHWQVGPRKTVAACLLKHGDDKCAICEAVERLKDSGDPEMEKQAADMTAQWGCMINLVDLNSPGSGVQTCRVGKQIMSILVGYDGDQEYGDISNPESGFDMIIERGPKNSQPLYTGRAARKESVVDDKDWLQKLPELDRAFRIYSYEEQQLVLQGEMVKTAGAATRVRGASEDTDANTSPSDEPKRTPVQKDEASATEKPKRKQKCFGNERVYDPKDAICTGCLVGPGKGDDACGKAVRGEDAPKAPEEKSSTEKVKGKFCSSCGNALAADAKFCPKCGAKVV